jgi:3-isopropylmalate dehydrogenase
MGLPDVRQADGTEIIPQLDIRFALDLYAGVRPIRTFAGLPGPLADARAAQIDLVLVRESTEGLFHARGRGRIEGSGADAAALDTMKITHRGTARVCDFALALARQRRARGRPGRVTNVDKANVFTSMAFWRQVFDERAAAFPDVPTEHAYVDAMALNLVMKPWAYDVLVTENMFGDILSDLIAALAGGMGMAPSADLGDAHALFQPAHGTAPDIAGQGIANPSATILSAAMMLDWLAERHGDAALADGARAMEAALAAAFARGEVRPREFGGHSSTADIVRAVIAGL